MKTLHFTGRSYWKGETLFTEITADFGYLLLYGDNSCQLIKIKINTKSYEEQRHYIDKIVPVRDFRQGGNYEVELMNGKKLNNWLKKHKYDKIES